MLSAFRHVLYAPRLGDYHGILGFKRAPFRWKVPASSMTIRRQNALETEQRLLDSRT